MKRFSQIVVRALISAVIFVPVTLAIWWYDGCSLWPSSIRQILKKNWQDARKYVLEQQHGA